MRAFGDRCVFLCARLYWVTKRLAERYLLLPFAFRFWRRRYARLSSAAREHTPLGELQLNSHQLREVTAGLQTASHVVLGEFDRDSLLQSRIGPLPGVADLTGDFQRRRHTRLQLVATTSGVGVRKYHLNRWRFLCELRALHVLQETGCRVPALLYADFEELAITSAYIPGSVLTERLAARSQAIRDRDIETHTFYEGLRDRGLWNARIREGNRVLYEAVTRDFGRQVLHELERVHAARVIWGDVKFGNIVVERRSGRPWLVDFDYAGHLPHLWRPLFDALRHAELAYFEVHFGTDVRTTASNAPDRSPLRAVENLLHSGD